MIYWQVCGRDDQQSFHNGSACSAVHAHKRLYPPRSKRVCLNRVRSTSCCVCVPGWCWTCVHTRPSGSNSAPCFSFEQSCMSTRSWNSASIAAGWSAKQACFSWLRWLASYERGFVCWHLRLVQDLGLSDCLSWAWCHDNFNPWSICTASYCSSHVELVGDSSVRTSLDGAEEEEKSSSRRYNSSRHTGSFARALR